MASVALRYVDTPSNRPDALEHYIGDLSFADYCRKAQMTFPFVLPLIDPSRVSGQAFRDYVGWMNKISKDFEGQDDGGRGVAYNVAQRNPDNRRTGTEALLRLFSASGKDMVGPDKVILDALGGDGTITRFLQSEKIQGPTIISGDLSGFMVQACLNQNLPCIRQSADRSLFKDSVLDGVLIAYGSHHLDADARETAASEAFRTIKDGGRFVLHDFEIGGQSARWFDEVVHPYSSTGHDFPHFTQQEMRTLLEDAGFSCVRVFRMSDPFVLKGGTEKEARENALRHLYHMYDLVGITGSEAQILEQVNTYTTEVLGKIEIERTKSGYTATVPREALVAVGTKQSPQNLII